MRLVGFYFVLALVFGAHATEANVSFSLLGATGATYKQFIANVRAAVTPRAQMVYGIPVLSNAAIGTAGFLLVQVTNYNRQSVTLALDVVNLYVVGYQAQNTAYFLNDAPPQALNELFRGSPQQRLPYGGNYDGLETAAGRVSRENIELGLSELDRAISNLFNHNAGTSVPRGFIVCIQTISEAARFKYIEQRISENVGTKFKPDPAFISLENNWGALSQQIQIAQTQGGKFSRAVELRSVSNQPVLVTDVNSPVVKGIALLLYYRARVVTDNVITMPSSTY